MSYECHITLPLPDPDGRVVLERFAKGWGWKTSSIDGDPLLGEKCFFYLTKHGTDYHQLYDEMQMISRLLVDNGGMTVLRKKIEHIIYDTKRSLIQGFGPEGARWVDEDGSAFVSPQ